MITYVILMTCNVVILLCWTLIDPFLYTRNAHRGTDNWNRVYRSYYGTCTSAGNEVPYIVCLVVINFGALCFANVQAYRARKIETEYSESRYIAFIMLTMFQTYLVCIPILALIREDPQASFVVLTIMICATCMATLLFLFMPKMMALRDWDSTSEARNDSSRSSGRGMTKFRSRATQLSSRRTSVGIIILQKIIHRIN